MYFQPRPCASSYNTRYHPLSPLRGKCPPIGYRAFLLRDLPTERLSPLTGKCAVIGFYCVTFQLKAMLHEAIFLATYNATNLALQVARKNSRLNPILQLQLLRCELQEK